MDAANLDHSILDDDEQRVLAVAAQRGDKAAAERLIRHNQRLVFSLAWRKETMAGAHTIEDLMQEGNRGLLEAIKRFDPTRKNRFVTYATYWVKAQINRFVYDHGQTASIPNRHAQRLQKARHARSQMYQDGCEPKIEDIALRIGMDAESLDALLKAVEPVELDYAVDVENFPIDEIVSNDEDLEEAVIDAITARQARRIIDAQPAYLRDILLDHFGFNGPPKTYRQIASGAGVPEHVIRSVVNRILEVIRAKVSG